MPLSTIGARPNAIDKDVSSLRYFSECKFDIFKQVINIFSKIGIFLEENVDTFLEEYALTISKYYLPIIWIVYFIYISYISSGLPVSESPFKYWYFFVFAVCGSLITNAIPAGGGIIYTPLIVYFLNDVHLAIDFSFLVIPIGNGILGMIQWLVGEHKSYLQTSLVLWRMLPYSLIPLWFGLLLSYILNITHYSLPANFVLLYFSFFSFLIASLCFFVYHYGSINNLIGKVFLTFSKKISQEYVEDISNYIETQNPTYNQADANSYIKLNTTVDSKNEFTSLEGNKYSTFADDMNILMEEPTTLMNFNDVDNNIDPNSFSAFDIVTIENSTSQSSIESFYYFVICIISFLSGLLIAPIIAIGVGVVNYVLLSSGKYILKFGSQKTMASSIFYWSEEQTRAVSVISSGLAFLPISIVSLFIFIRDFYIYKDSRFFDPEGMERDPLIISKISLMSLPGVYIGIILSRKLDKLFGQLIFMFIAGVYHFIIGVYFFFLSSKSN